MENLLQFHLHLHPLKNPISQIKQKMENQLITRSSRCGDGEEQRWGLYSQAEEGGPPLGPRQQAAARPSLPRRARPPGRGAALRPPRRHVGLRQPPRLHPPPQLGPLQPPGTPPCRHPRAQEPPNPAGALRLRRLWPQVPHPPRPQEALPPAPRARAAEEAWSNEIPQGEEEAEI